MNRIYEKRDRTARLLKLQILLWYYPDGLKIEEIANKCAVSKKTAYRDLRALESEIGIPIWEDGSKRGIADGYFLPPINFTLPEALNIFLAARLMEKLTPENHPSLTSVFMKIGTILPPSLRVYIQKIIGHIEKKPMDERKVNNFNKINQAWLSRHCVKILYQESSDKKPIERIIEPYFLEPVAPGGGNYIIAYCHYKKSIYTYKLNRIIGEAHIEDDVYEIPSDFNYDDYLSLAWPWSIFTNEKIEKVKVHFSPRIKEFITENIWHPSQLIEIRGDGSVIMTIEVPINANLHWWLLSWGENAEVLEPEILRDQISKIARSLLKIYDHKK